MECIDVVKHAVAIYFIRKRKYKINCLAKFGKTYAFIFWTFYVSLLLYGNTVVYSDHVKECRAKSLATRKMWGLLMYSIAMGYLVFIPYVAMLSILMKIAYICVAKG